MRGKLKVPVGAAVLVQTARGLAVKISLASTDNAEGDRIEGARGGALDRGRACRACRELGLPQGNIDAGKSPAQMFADTCSNCHRRPSELKRGASASFLRQHYTPGAQEAAAMASYLAGVPAADPRAGKEKAKAPQEKDKAKQQHRRSRRRAPAGAAEGRPAGAAASAEGQAARARQVGRRASAGSPGGNPRRGRDRPQARAVRGVGTPTSRPRPASSVSSAPCASALPDRRTSRRWRAPRLAPPPRRSARR